MSERKRSALRDIYLDIEGEELRKLLGEFVKFFNNERIHQGLDYKTPDEVYREGSFPSAIIKKMAAA